jgi:hypothetical protein
LKWWWRYELNSTHLLSSGAATFLNLGLVSEVWPEVRTLIPGIGQGGCQDHGENNYAGKQHQHNFDFPSVLLPEFN